MTTATRRRDPGQARRAWPVAALAALAMPALTAVVVSPVSGQEVRTEAEVIAAVRASSLTLDAARTGAAAAALRPEQVRWSFPMVEVMPMPAMILDGDPGAQVMARQTIPRPSRLAADRTARARMADAAASEATALELELVAMARMAYAELWGLEARAERIAEYVARLELYREAALAQYRTGRGPQQAVLGIQIEAEVLAQRLEALLEERAGEVARLAALTGGAVRLGPGDRLAPPSRPAPVEGAAAYVAAVGEHPRVEAGVARSEAESAMADMSRSMLRPEFTVGVNLNLSRMAFDRMYGQEPVMPAVGVMLPLWRRGVRAEIREAELRASQRDLETADTRLQLEADLTDVLAQLDRVRARIGRYEDRLRPQVQQAIESTLAGYQTGAVRFLELLDVQRMALDVEVDLIMARVREAGLAARLDAITGRIPTGSTPGGPER